MNIYTHLFFSLSFCDSNQCTILNGFTMDTSTMGEFPNSNSVPTVLLKLHENVKVFASKVQQGALALSISMGANSSFPFTEGAMGLLPHSAVGNQPVTQLEAESPQCGMGCEYVCEHLSPWSLQGHKPVWKINWLLSGSKSHQNKIQKCF